MRVGLAVVLAGCGFEAQLDGVVAADAAIDGVAVDGSIDGSIDTPAPASVVVVDGHSSGQVQYATSLVIAHTVPSTANRLLLVGVSTSFAGTQVLAVTYGATALTRVGVRDAQSQDGRVELWSVVAPPAGTANVAIAVDDALSSVVAGIGSFSNVHQTAPLGGWVSANGTAGKPAISVTAAAGEIVHDVVMWNGGDYSTLTVDAGQLAPWKIASDKIIGGGSTKPGSGAATSLSWTVVGNYDDYWAIGAVAIKPL